MIMNSSNHSRFFVHLCCLVFFTFPFVILAGSSETLCIPSEREALLKFKHHLNDTSNRLSSWNATVNTNCCEWKGVVCNNVTAHVVELHLNISPPSIDWYDDAVYEAYKRSQFGGEINPCLVHLKHLNYLDLSGNYFKGMQIPTFIARITSLTYLNLSNARFSGKIPHQIGNLSNLLYLDLGKNEISGEIPYQIGNLTKLVHLDLHSYSDEPLFGENLHWLSSLWNLEYVDMGGANLSKSFDWLQTMLALPSLMELHLSFCTLNHSNQPSSLNFSSLLTLDLSFAFYSPVISFVPNWIFGLTKLVSLQLSLNNIQGPIPNGIQNLTLLENLDLSDNSFSSSLPDWVYGLHHLKFLNLAFNNLHGNISDALGNLTSLVGLDLLYNQLEGKIPTSLGNLCKLREIDFSYLKLNQRVNEILEILTPCVSYGLKSLRIRSSQLSGNLVDQLGVFKNIDELDFQNNSIHGALPRSLGKLSSLRNLDLSNNQFNGNPFETLRSLSKLSFLDIGGNHFEGVVKEDDLANLTSLKSFYALGNNFSLKVGANWHPTFQVRQLEMRSWKLGGPSFPQWIQSQKDLDFLDLSNTGISDSIPTWFWENVSFALYLNLSHNHIYGELVNMLKNPISIRNIDLSSNHLYGKLPYLSNRVYLLDLSNNTFSGSMTDLLCKRENSSLELQTLNLALNNLSGKIPDCWIMWPFIKILILKNNRFVGSLPPSMGSLRELQLLDIRNNSLSGNFPTILKKTSMLFFLDLGENNFSGIIPTWVGEMLLNMKILCLRSNRFFGNIPNKLCHMSFLQDLDLAQNNLSGNIPNCFNHLNAMLLKNKSTDLFIYCPTNYSFGGDCIASTFLWIKGRGIEYRNLLGLVTNIDLSNNNLSGGIPIGITNLDGLIFLNLSNNQLTGQIPPSIGNMRSLESIDLSRNHLLGEIPSTISNLSFLSKLDLSYNRLKGKIPTGTQLQSFEASNFVGNDLCGPPLPINCSSSRQNPNDHSGKESDGHGVNWIFVSMAFGFIVGFWLVVAPLFIYRSWRFIYFRFLDDMWYKLQSYW